MLRKALLVRLCVVVCVLFSVLLKIFCITSFGDYTRQQHQETTDICTESKNRSQRRIITNLSFNPDIIDYNL